ncbi:retrovirus-related pol polyprotein from transposon TNT 1-94 [Tanacetum coccineum]
MADMTKKVPLGMVENILIKIDKFLFSFDFVIIDMLKAGNETMILGRPFLATIHAEIGVFNKEISLGIGNDKIIFDVGKKSYKLTIPIEKAYMGSTNDNERIDLTWDNLSLNDWKKIRYGKVCKLTRDRILKDNWKERSGEEDDDTDEGWEDPEKYEEE